MNILSYIKSLVPILNRSEVLATLVQLKDELNDDTLPVVRDMANAFARHQFRSPLGKAMLTQFKRHIQSSEPPLQTLLAALEALQSNLPLLESETKRLFGIHFSTSSLTYNRVELLRYIETACFYVRYYRKLMLHLVADEAAQLGRAAPKEWPRAEYDWLMEHLERFMRLFAVMRIPSEQLKQLLAQIPAAEANEDTLELALRVHGERKLDPLRLNHFMPVTPTRNPLFALGKWRAELMVKRYKAAKEEAVALQYRLQELRELQQGGNTEPKLQQHIKYIEQRIAKLDYDIHRIEEDNRWSD